VFIDRVDQLEDGSRVILDYKTGRVRPAWWFGERPEDPQLPLYGVASRSADGGRDGANGLAGVAFAQVRPDRLGFSGVVRGDDVLPDLPVNRKGPLKEAAEQWPRVLDEWSVVLERLAAEFAAGEAGVDPKNGLNTCREHYCELAPLCRIRETLPGEAGDGGDGPGEDDDD
jgi:RecB family exonuclease